MKRLVGLSALALVISSTSGCGWLWGEEGYFRDRGSDYMQVQRAPVMQVPEGIQTRSLEPLLPIPDHVADARLAEKFELPRPNALEVREQTSDFSLQKTGATSYLVAQRMPAEVWPIVREYLTDNGVVLAEERVQTGELVGAWQRPQALSAGLSRNVPNADEVRVRVRVEPGVQRGTSEIFVATATRNAGEQATGWDTQNQEGLAKNLLANVQSASSGSVSLLVARDYDAPERVSLTADGSGNPVLSLDTDLNRAWSSVGRALEKANVRVEDLNRTSGVYYINLAEAAKEEDKPGFISRMLGRGDSAKDIEARAERYQVRLSEVAGRVHISVEKDLNTVAPAETAREILDLIQNNLG